VCDGRCGGGQRTRLEEAADPWAPPGGDPRGAARGVVALLLGQNSPLAALLRSLVFFFIFESPFEFPICAEFVLG
jgi:hypothetical protein